MLYRLLRPLLFSLDPEQAHLFAINTLRFLQVSPLGSAPLRNTRLGQELWGLHFPNPIGLAAGYDKNAKVPLAWSPLGFGFAELGTITAKGQPGQPKPRIFRLEQDQACINRLGFNNDGAALVADRLSSVLPVGRPHPIPLGFNIGKSKVTPLEDAVRDYMESAVQLLPFADYLVVNVSSPNTPDLRKLQEIERLGLLLEALIASARRLAAQTSTRPTPVLVKISPDLNQAQIIEIAKLALAVGISGLIATNTTIARPGLQNPINETGGLSGRPLNARATRVLRLIFQNVEGKLPLIGVGGIFSAADAYDRICAGASLIQIYTGMIYEGPFLARRIAYGLLDILEKHDIKHVSEAIGKNA